jgi:hypothetical protein
MADLSVLRGADDLVRRAWVSRRRDLDATTLDVLARAEFEVPLPLGFHGSFTPAAKA